MRTHRITRHGLPLALLVALVSPSSAFAQPAPKMSAETKAILERHTSDAQRIAIFAALAKVQQDSLGPAEFAAEDLALVAAPATRIPFQPAAYAGSGDGSEEKPFVDAIRRFIERERPAAGSSIVLPAGRYAETPFVLPEGVWLVGSGRAVITPRPPADLPRTAGAGKNAKEVEPLITLSTRAGLFDLELDGANVPAIGAVGSARGSADAVIARCHVRRFTRFGIQGSVHCQRFHWKN